MNELQISWGEGDEIVGGYLGVPKDVPLRHPSDIPTVIGTGLAKRYCGELAVFGGDVLGRVYLFEGNIAWAHCTTHGENLGDVLCREAGVTADGLERGVARCRSSGGKLGHALVDLGFVTHAELRHCVRTHVGAHLGHVLSMGGELRASFDFDGEHHYDEALLLTWPEALEAAGVWR